MPVIYDEERNAHGGRAQLLPLTVPKLIFYQKRDRSQIFLFLTKFPSIFRQNFYQSINTIPTKLQAYYGMSLKMQSSDI